MSKFIGFDAAAERVSQKLSVIAAEPAWVDPAFWAMFAGVAVIFLVPAGLIYLAVKWIKRK